MPVVIQDIRDLLDAVPNQSVPDPTIQKNIDRATNFVNSIKDASASVSLVEDAIRAMAVWLTYGSYSEGISEQIGETSQALKTKLDHYKSVAELYINMVSTEFISLDPKQKKEEMFGENITTYRLSDSAVYD